VIPVPIRAKPLGRVQPLTVRCCVEYCCVRSCGARWSAHCSQQRATQSLPSEVRPDVHVVDAGDISRGKGPTAAGKAAVDASDRVPCASFRSVSEREQSLPLGFVLRHLSRDRHAVVVRVRHGIKELPSSTTAASHVQNPPQARGIDITGQPCADDACPAVARHRDALLGGCCVDSLREPEHRVTVVRLPCPPQTGLIPNLAAAAIATAAFHAAWLI
jgi:hypothetical protein